MLPFGIQVSIIAHAPYYLSLLVSAFFQEQSEVLDLLIIIAIWSKIHFCIISQIICIIHITIKDQWQPPKIDEYTLKMQKADSHWKISLFG